MSQSPGAIQQKHVDEKSIDRTIASAFSDIGGPMIDSVMKITRDLENAADPEIFHQLRISLRKLRALWWVFRPLGRADSMNAADDMFKRLAKAAGDTRDWDVLAQVLAEDKTIRDALPGIAEKIAEQRGQAFLESRTSIGRFDISTDLNDMFEEMKTQLTPQGQHSLGKFLKKRVKLARKRLAKKVRKALRSKRTDYAHLHDVRKAAKKLRYIFELFDPFLKGNSKKIIKRLAGFQKKLGSLNDLVVSRVLLQSATFMDLDHHELELTLKWMDDQKKVHLRAARKLLNRSGM